MMIGSNLSMTSNLLTCAPIFSSFYSICSFSFVFSVHEWIKLNREWLSFLKSSLNPGTWRNWGQHVKAYMSFAACFKFSLLPLQTTCVCMSMTHLTIQGKKQSTIKNYLNSLSTYGKLRGYQPLNLNNIFIRLTL